MLTEADVLVKFRELQEMAENNGFSLGLESVKGRQFALASKGPSEDGSYSSHYLTDLSAVENFLRGFEAAKLTKK